MALFYGTFENKVDRKGRVLVPVPFRQVLATSAFQGFVARPSYRKPCIEACDVEFMEKLQASMASNDLYSDAHEDLGYTIFADSQPITVDSTGRVTLPEDLMAHAGISAKAGKVGFVGISSRFEIWEPEAMAEHKAQARENARKNGLTLPMQPGGGT